MNLHVPLAREEALYAQARQAMEYVQNQPQVVPEYVVAAAGEAYASYRDLPDDTPLPDIHGGLPAEQPDVIRVETAEEFYVAQYALSEVHGVRPDRDEFVSNVKHESAHLRVAKHAGFQSVRYCVKLVASRQRAYVSFPFIRSADPVRPPTKLDMGAIAAATRTRSSHDYRFMRSLGYEDEVAVARAIVHAEDPRLASLPLPEGWLRGYAPVAAARQLLHV